MAKAFHRAGSILLVAAILALASGAAAQTLVPSCTGIAPSGCSLSPGSSRAQAQACLTASSAFAEDARDVLFASSQATFQDILALSYENARYSECGLERVLAWARQTSDRSVARRLRGRLALFECRLTQMRRQASGCRL
jgi:hypothetical protein